MDMDILDFVPFMGFIRNDEETIAIMNQASKILPKACDILGISLSYSESDFENDDTAEDTNSSSSQPQQVQAKRRRLVSKPKHEASVSVQIERVPKPPKTRKRCASTPSLGQSTSTGATSCATTIAALKEAPSQLPPKKRRLHSISSSTNSSNIEDVEEGIRRKMMADIETFKEKIQQLAALEKTKNKLLEKLLSVSSYAQLQSPGNGNDNAVRNQNGSGNENQSEIESQNFGNQRE